MTIARIIVVNHMPNTATAAGIVADSRIVAASRIVYAVAVKAGMMIFRGAIVEHWLNMAMTVGIGTLPTGIMVASRIVYAAAVEAGMTVVPFPALLGRITIAVSVPPI